MNLIVILLLLMIGLQMFILCKLKTGTYFNFGSIYAMLWTVIGIMANSGIYDIYLPSAIVNTSILVGLFVFGLVYAVCAKKEVVSAEEILNMNSVVRLKAIVITNLAAMVFMLPYFFVSLSIIRTKGFAYLRAINYAGSEITGRSTFINLILQNVCFPLFFACAIIGIIMLFLSKRGALQIVIISLINVVIYEFINGARNGFVIIILVVVFAFIKVRFPLVKKRIQTLSKWKRSIIYPIVFGLVWIVVYITGERSLGGKSIFENFYYYFFAGPSYLSQLLNQMQGYKLNSDLFFGSATFGFVYNILATVLNVVLGMNVFNSGYVMNSVLSNAYYNVSNSTRINAMATSFFPFLMDFGYAGIIIGPALIALISQYISRNQKKHNSIRWYAIVIYWTYVLFRTIFKWELISMSAFFVFFFIVVFTKKDPRHENQSK